MVLFILHMVAIVTILAQELPSVLSTSDDNAAATADALQDAVLEGAGRLIGGQGLDGGYSPVPAPALAPA